MKERWEENRQHESELDWARAEAVYDALPQSVTESHKMIRDLQKQVAALFAHLNAAGPKWRERLYGFGFGIISSLVATAVWPKLVSAIPSLW